MVKEQEYILEVQDIHKAFFQNEVLKGVSFGVRKGEILGLLGSNGAGKSTLMKIINGIYTHDSGKIILNGESVNFKSANDARIHGIAMVYQEFSLIPTLTVTENMFLNREVLKNGLIDDKECLKQTQEALKDFGIHVNPNEMVGNLSIGNQQLVEIVKALMQKPSVLILDEPTASLTGQEIELLFKFIRNLKAQGIAVFMITHHMQEIQEICDRVVILRNGTVEMNKPCNEVTVPIMVEAMIGKKLSGEYLPPQKVIQYDKPLLSVTNLVYKNKVNGISFDVYPNEIVGIAGLLGSGRTETLKCIYGLAKSESGEIVFENHRIDKCKPWTSIEKGIYFIPEDRRKDGIIGIHSIKTNIMISIWKRICKFHIIDDKNADKKSQKKVDELAIKCTGIEQNLQYLSGGNQQKVVFAKGLVSNPKLLLMDDPTVGIDVEAKAAITKIIRDVVDNGCGVIIVSSEMEQLEQVCDRVLIYKAGKIRKILNRSKGDQITESVLSQEIQL